MNSTTPQNCFSHVLQALDADELCTPPNSFPDTEMRQLCKRVNRAEVAHSEVSGSHKKHKRNPLSKGALKSALPLRQRQPLSSLKLYLSLIVCQQRQRACVQACKSVLCAANVVALVATTHTSSTRVALLVYQNANPSGACKPQQPQKLI